MKYLHKHFQELQKFFYMNKDFNVIFINTDKYYFWWYICLIENFIKFNFNIISLISEIQLDRKPIYIFLEKFYICFETIFHYSN